MEIGADSVVFVNEEEIGGRRGVVKVGGVGGVEMTLSMVDQNEAHNWITAIKQAVLSERWGTSCYSYSTATHVSLFL